MGRDGRGRYGGEFPRGKEDRDGEFQMGKRNWQSHNHNPLPLPPRPPARGGGGMNWNERGRYGGEFPRGRGGYGGGFQDQRNWQPHNPLPLPPSAHPPARGGGGMNPMRGEKRPFGTDLTNQRFNPPAQKNARHFSPPQRQLNSVLGNVVRLSFDKEGNRRIQQVLNEGGPNAATAILKEGLAVWADAMTHTYGSHVFRKLLECINPGERVTLVQSVSARLVDASCNKFGSRSVQEIVEVCSREEAACNHIVFMVLTDALGPNAARLSVDNSATFVIQCILRELPYQYTQCIIDDIAANIENVACNCNGYFVVLHCLDCHSAACTHVVKRLVANSLEFMQNAYANFPLRKALDVCGDDVVRAICESVIGRVCHLAVHKYGTHGIQKCLELCSDRVRDQYLHEVISSGCIQMLMIDTNGSFFVQKAFLVATDVQAIRLFEMMKPFLSSQDSTYEFGILRQMRKRFPNFDHEVDANGAGQTTLALVESSSNEAGSLSGDLNLAAGRASIANSGEVPNDSGTSTSTSRVEANVLIQPPSAPDGEPSSVQQQNVSSDQSDPNNFANLDSALEAMRSRKLEQQSSNQTQATAIVSANAVSTPRDDPNRTSAARRSSSKVLDVVEPSKEFWARNIYSEDETVSRLEDKLNKTNAHLRREMGLSPTDEYPEAIERILQEIYNLIKEFVLALRAYIVANCTNENGQFEVRKLNEFDTYVQGGYSISSSGNVEKTKTGSAVETRGIRGRSKVQVPTGTNLNDCVGVLFTLEGIRRILKSDAVLGQLADRIYQLLPWAGSYNAYPSDYVVNNLAEVGHASFLPGDGGFLGEWLLYGGKLSVYNLVRRPPPTINATAESALSIEEIRVGMSWPRQITQVFDQITQGETFDGRQLSIIDMQMVKAMLHLNEFFIQQFFIYFRLLRGVNPQVKVHGHVNAVSRSPIDIDIERLTRRTAKSLNNVDIDVSALKQMLKDGLEEYYCPDERFYWLEQRIAGDPDLLAHATAQMFDKLVADSIASGKKTLILAERTCQKALKRHQPDVFEKIFGEDKFVTCIYCADGTTVAGHLYIILEKIKILVMGSCFIINAEGKSFKTRETSCQEFVAVKSLLAQAGVVTPSSANEEVQYHQAFLNQMAHPISNQMATIKNNTFTPYHFGEPGREGFQAMINILKNKLGLKGIHHEIMATFALKLGADNFQKLFAVFGYDIDCSNMTETMLRLKREQKDQGVMPTLQRQSIALSNTQTQTGRPKSTAKRKTSGRTHTEETKQKMKGRTSNFKGHTHTEEAKQKISQTKTQLTEQVKADRNSQFDEYIKEHQLVDGEMSTICWDRQKTTWDVRLRQSHFGNPTRAGRFKRLCDANDAMKHLDKVLKNKSKREDETFVNEVIEHVKRVFNAGKKGGKWKRSELDNIL